ncbi:MAG TPA: thioredoxin fold domain-containing protein [archaeon]|nr:thioredoxin fold domain-containing protein [archaeon]
MKAILGILLISMIFLLGCTQQEANIVADVMEQDDSAMEKEDSMIDKGDAMEIEDSEAENVSASALFIPFTKTAYEMAKAEGKPIFLMFHANWCPTCARQKPINEQAFRNPEMPSNAIGFQVNYNDNETDADETALAREFNVTYQHTLFFINSGGEQISRITGNTSEARIIELMNQAAGA